MARRKPEQVSDSDLDQRYKKAGLKLLKLRYARGPELGRRESPELTRIWAAFEARERAWGWTRSLKRVEYREATLEALKAAGAPLPRRISDEALRRMQPELKRRHEAAQGSRSDRQ